MFSKLPDLFDRNFAVGYFLPALVCVVAGMMLLDATGTMTLSPPTAAGSSLSVLIDTTLIGAFVWLLGVFLMVINRELIRILEGYGRFNPARLLSGIERGRLERLNRKIAQLEHEYQMLADADNEASFSEAKNQRLDRLQRRRVEYYPDAPYLLPTSLGNIIRAFEVYPRLMYGIDAIPGWTRLQAVIPTEYRDIVQDAKAQFDFWVNLWWLSFGVLVVYLTIVIERWFWIMPWVAPLLIGLLLVAYQRAKDVAFTWGEYLKGAFDVYLPELCTKLGLPTPPTRVEAQQQWRAYSQAVIYVLPDVLPALRRQSKGRSETRGSSE